MINLKVTQAQWDCAKNEMNDTPGMAMESNDGINYKFTSNMLDADLKYGNGILLINITAKHGMAKFASEATISNHLADMLGAMQCSNTPAPVLN